MKHLAASKAQQSKLFDTLIQLCSLARMNKPIGTLLLLWPCLIALFSAYEGFPDFKILLIFVIGTFVMRSAGCIINDIADIDFDIHVTRTKERPLTSGRLNLLYAWAFFFFLLCMALLLVTFLKFGTFLLSIAALFLAVIYPFMKRWTNYPQMVLSLAFSWSIPMVYYESLEVLNASTYCLWLATIFWIIAYDTVYAMVDRKDDLEVGIKSTAIAFGVYDVKVVTVLYSLFFIFVMMFGYYSVMPGLYYLGVLVSFVYWFLDIYRKYSTKKESLCFEAFLKNNKLGMILFCFVALCTTF